MTLDQIQAAVCISQRLLERNDLSANVKLFACDILDCRPRELQKALDELTGQQLTVVD